MFLHFCEMLFLELVKLWNSLPYSILSCDSVNTFKHPLSPKVIPGSYLLLLLSHKVTKTSLDRYLQTPLSLAVYVILFIDVITTPTGSYNE